MRLLFPTLITFATIVKTASSSIVLIATHDPHLTAHAYFLTSSGVGPTGALDAARLH